MRIAHVTDLHVEARPELKELFNKRLLGATNLYLLGRAAHFSREVQEALVPAVLATRPDLVLCTGDLTATATEREFTEAAQLLEPITRALPFLVIPGNHDVYTEESVGRFGRHFGAWSNGGRLPWVQPVGPLDVLAVETCHPSWLSSGRAGADQLALFDALLAASDRPAVVMLHYPLRGRDGGPYGPRARALDDARAVEDVLARHPRVRCVLHGHEHHGYRTMLGELPIFNPGSSGYAWLPDKGRTAHFNVLDLPVGGGPIGVSRYAWDGAAFVPETGGAYATGR